MTTPLPSNEARWPVSHCSSERCRAPIIWAYTERHKGMPLDAAPSPAGRYRIEDRGGHPYAVYVHPVEAIQPSLAGDEPPPLYTSHYASCVDADAFRRGRR